MNIPKNTLFLTSLPIRSHLQKANCFYLCQTNEQPQVLRVFEFLDSGRPLTELRPQLRLWFWFWFWFSVSCLLKTQQSFMKWSLFPLQLQSAVDITEQNHTSGSLLQSGWSTGVKINHLFNPEVKNWSLSSPPVDERLRVFIPPGGLDLHLLLYNEVFFFFCDGSERILKIRLR